jgi:hypothetical protein
MRRRGALLRRGSWRVRRDGAPFARAPWGITASASDLLDEAQKIDPEEGEQCAGPGGSCGDWELPSGASLRQAAVGPRGKAAPAAPLMRMAGTFRPSRALMRRRSGTMQAYSRVGATDNGACPARHRGDRAHGRAGREQRSGPKQEKVAASGRRMVLARRRVALVRRRTASSRCMVAPARRVDAANDAKCPGDASAWLRRRDGQGGLSVGMARGYGCMVGGAGSMRWGGASSRRRTDPHPPHVHLEVERR